MTPNNRPTNPNQTTNQLTDRNVINSQNVPTDTWHNVIAPHADLLTNNNLWLNCMQINLRHSKAASANLSQLLLDINIHIALIQEPYAYHHADQFTLCWCNSTHTEPTTDILLFLNNLPFFSDFILRFGEEALFFNFLKKERNWK